MASETLLEWADQAARQRPGGLVEDTFGADWHAHKVGGRVFMLASAAPGNDARVIVKVDPIRAEVLRLQHPGITAAGHRLKELRDVFLALCDGSIWEKYRVAQSQLSTNRFFLLAHSADAEALPRYGDAPHFLDGIVGNHAIMRRVCIMVVKTK